MTLQRANPTQELRLTIHLTNMRKPQLPTIKILPTMKKTEADPSAARKTIDSMVADMYLSLIN